MWQFSRSAVLPVAAPLVTVDSLSRTASAVDAAGEPDPVRSLRRQAARWQPAAAE